MSKPAVQVEHLWKNFRLYQENNQFIKAAVLRGRRARYEEFWAVKDVSFEVPFGTTFGIIGSNGSGKSTLLKCLAKILYPNKGSITVNGRLGALLELGAGFHYELSGRENIFLNGAILGMSRRDLVQRFDEIVEFAGLEKFIDTPVKNYSSGMIVRLGFAIAANVEPEILLIDEVLSVGDASFQRKSIEKIEQFRKDGRTIIVVSHSTSQLQELCQDIAWLEKGDLRAIGAAHDVISDYSKNSYSGVASSGQTAGKHWGSGEVTIKSIRIAELDSAENSYLTTGSDAHLLIDFSSRSKIEDCCLSVKITTIAGLTVWESKSSRNGLKLDLVPGEFSVTIGIPQVLLLDGTYLISATASNSVGSIEYDHLEDGFRFNVYQGERPDTGVLALDSSWSMSH